MRSLARAKVVMKDILRWMRWIQLDSQTTQLTGIPFRDTQQMDGSDSKLTAFLNINHLWKQHSTPALLRVYERFHKQATHRELTLHLRHRELLIPRRGY